jgi:hypothetical protein
MSGFPFSRRAALAALSYGGGAYFLPSLAKAQATTPPKRLLIFYTYHCNPYMNWNMRNRPGMPADKEWEFDLKATQRSEWKKVLAPLYDHRDKLLVLDTLAQDLGLQGHGPSNVTQWTGTRPYQSASYHGGDAGANESFDQVIGRRNMPAGGLKSLELGAGIVYYNMFWQAKDKPMPYLRTGEEAFNRVFANRVLPKPGGTTTAPTAPTRADKYEAARVQILEMERLRYQTFASKLSTEDKLRLQNHSDLINDLAVRLKVNASGGSGGATVGCMKPELAKADTDYNTNIDNYGRIATMAFACDITRTISIEAGQMEGKDFGVPSHGRCHSDPFHHENDPAKISRAGDYYAGHARQLARILDQLRAVKDTDGKTLLDNTMVVWTGEAGSWYHQAAHAPVFIAGGAGFKMGRYLYWPATPIHGPVDYSLKSGNSFAKQQLGPPIYKLNVSIAQQLGLKDVNQIGQDTVAPATGRNITGPLPRLL